MRTPYVRLWMGLGLLASSLATTTQAADEPLRFVYDEADELVPSSFLASENGPWYDASVAWHDGALWIASLEFEPDRGDIIWLARWADGQLVNRKRITPNVGTYAKPTLTASGRQLWLTPIRKDRSTQQAELADKPNS